VYSQQFDQAIAWVDEAIGIYRSIDDEQGLAYALARRGHHAFASGDFPTAMATLQESLDVCQKIGYDDGTAWPITLLAQARRWSGEESPEIREMLEDGRRRFIAMGEVYGQVHADMVLGTLYGEGVEYQLRHNEEMARLGEQPGADRLSRSLAFHGLANSVWDHGEFDRAEGLNRAAARSALETGVTVNTGLALLQAATFAGHRGAAKRSATLFGAGDTHFAMQKAPFMEKVYQPAIDAARKDLGPGRYEELYDRGASMTVGEATDVLLSA
jgi:tetratricopeptide (TPR) repeat protein